MKREAPAVARNRDPITAVLAQELPDSGTVLEVASGTGEHALHFAQAFPALRWQPSDPDVDARASIVAWAQEAELDNLELPLAIDAAAPVWPLDHADAVVCINMVHISEWDATVGLFKGCARVLTAPAPIILYGPYLEDQVETAASNLEFDRSLKARNPAWGLRQVDEVDRVASGYGFERTNRYEMPANNLMLIYRMHSA